MAVFCTFVPADDHFFLDSGSCVCRAINDSCLAAILGVMPERNKLSEPFCAEGALNALAHYHHKQGLGFRVGVYQNSHS